MHYQIKTKKGYDVGIYKGDSVEEAFLDMMRCGGYTDDQIWIEDDKICYYSADYLLLCGRPEDYKITPI